MIAADSSCEQLSHSPLLNRLDPQKSFSNRQADFLSLNNIKDIFACRSILRSPMVSRRISFSVYSWYLVARYYVFQMSVGLFHVLSLIASPVLLIFRCKSTNICNSSISLKLNNNGGCSWAVETSRQERSPARNWRARRRQVNRRIRSLDWDKIIIFS